MILDSQIDITGAVIKVITLPIQINFILGVYLFFIPLLLALVDSTSIDEVVEKLHNQIKQQKESHKSNPKYLSGLSEIEQTIDIGKEEYKESKSNWIRGNILDRLKRWEDGIVRREQYFFGIPHHIKGVSDLPDRGLYNYRPLSGKKTKYIELEVTHYTDQSSYKKIKGAFEQEKKELILKDGAGWAYFVSEPLPERLDTKELRVILGTGLQDYVPFPKLKERNPESVIIFKIKVQKERVLVRTESYKLKSGKEINVKKYAIAGGIYFDDLMKNFTPVGGRYLSKRLEEYHTREEKWGIV
ncbi:hypothetical protein HY498_03695 [Candidatus Woesearchaeota archaeon]|nr:hypothetical protein [Candidatus Woesearchaeota archaeon]